MPYTSKSQLARLATEAWMAENGYCLACNSDRLRPTKANTQARDFECDGCGHPYELKSSAHAFGSKVVDGAYESMMRRVEGRSVPTFLLLHYSGGYVVSNLMAVHRSLITREVILQRKPLAPSARRAGWVGCNILLRAIPPEGRIQLLRDGVEIPKAQSRKLFLATSALEGKPLHSRNWSRLVLQCLHKIPGPRFTLSQAYAFESELQGHFPENRNIQARIRQQLQVLRDAGLLTFESRGAYRFTFGSTSASPFGERLDQ